MTPSGSRMAHKSAPMAEGETDIGARIHALAARIFPINRSITGDGVRQTLQILNEYAPISHREVPTGTRIFDWSIPREWNVRDAYVKDPSGRKIIDFSASNLHLMGYSIPVNARMPLDQLKPHLHTLPEQPDIIPYRTSYYDENWGFCLPHNQLLNLAEGTYEVLIDSDLKDGSLTYGEFCHPGGDDGDILFSTHICHPSLANDNCAGLALLTFVAAALEGRSTRYRYRFLFAPGTIGALSWLADNLSELHHIRHGLVISCIGDGGGPTYKKSRGGDAIIDRAVACVRCNGDTRAEMLPFSPYGYDERQFNAPGFNLPVGLLQRSRFGAFPEYHSSADNLDFIRPQYLASSFQMVMDIIELLETNWVPLNLFPMGEPQLGRRGLFSKTGGHKDASLTAMAYLWILNLADGQHSLLDIAERADMAFSTISKAAKLLLNHGLLSKLRDA
jgi:aminopeptidase-like protein